MPVTISILRYNNLPRTHWLSDISMAFPEGSLTSIFIDEPLHYILSFSKPAFDLSLNETDELEDEKSEPVTQSIQVEHCSK